MKLYFHKPALQKVHPAIHGITAYATMPGIHTYDPTEWCVKNSLLIGDLNPRPLTHEFSALTTKLIL